MRSVRRIVFATAAFMLVTTSAHAAGRIEFILDVSGSMNAMAGGEKKIAAARSAIASAIKTIPDDSIVALRFYGHRVPNKNKAESCKDSQLVIPFGPIDKQQFLAAVNQTTPLGQTPIAFSLEEAAEDFGPAKDEQTAIILVSDGEETCGGDPAAVAKNLLAQGFKVTIHTIGFDVDPKTRAQLESISKITGGQYRDAKDATGLAQSLEQLTQESLVIEKEKSVYGEPIRGGDSYETAVVVEPGKLYRLDHHQKKGDFDYFYIDLTGGQKITAIIQTGERGVDIREGRATEDNNPYAGIQIHNSDREKVAYETIIGSRNKKEEVWINLGDEHGGRYYILVGNTYDDQHKDNPFMVEVTDRFDAGSKRDAGATEATALSLQPGTFVGYLGPGDRTDMYRFTAAPGSSYAIKARGSSDKLKLRMTILDSDGINLASQDSPNPGAAASIDRFAPPKAGDYFIHVSSYYSDVPLTDYTMSIEQTTGDVVVSQVTPQVTQPSKEMPPLVAAPTVVQPSEASGSPLAKLSLREKIKFILMFSGIPLAAGLLIGVILGYLRGKKAR